LESANALDIAGCFSIVLEKVKPETAKEISTSINCPTIGIGAGIDCDGQILVTNDILGLFDEFKPSFVRKYADLKSVIIDSVSSYIKDTIDGNFPGSDEV
jgi:3-methyl-2-oxobutanoate hydroxymethyltransferase